MSLPEGIVAMLREEIGCSAECEDLAELAREYYQKGMGGQPYEPDFPPEGLFPTDIVEIVNRFLRYCWEQGRQDTEVISHG